MVTALILSGGVGTRIGGDIAKQYIEVGGRPIISYCIETLSRHNLIDGIWIVAGLEWQGKIREWIDIFDVNGKFRGFSLPGENRQLSIYNGICGIGQHTNGNDYVFVHDAARPFLSEGMITQCIEAVSGHDGVIPVLPMKDTVYLSSDGKSVSSLLRREEVYAGQAPEVFVFGKYLKANERLLPDEILRINGSTEPAVMAGMDIVMVAGDEGNFKVTTKADLERMRAVIDERMGIVWDK